MPNEAISISVSDRPDRIVMLVDEDAETDIIAEDAVSLARSLMPKVTGGTANSLMPIFGDGYFGIYAPDKVVWFLERGISGFTMNNLQGKTIPMWIDDPTGAERRGNPKAKTRLTRDGRTQVLIFRRAGLKGTRRSVLKRNKDGSMKSITVPTSYPGAPGRIARRSVPGMQIRTGNVGVRWRHPGTVGREFLNAAMSRTAFDHEVGDNRVYLVDQSSFFSVVGT